MAWKYKKHFTFEWSIVKKNKTMPATYNLTSAKISRFGLSLLFKQLDMSCLETGWVGGNSVTTAKWRIYTRQ